MIRSSARKRIVEREVAQHAVPGSLSASWRSSTASTAWMSLLCLLALVANPPQSAAHALAPALFEIEEQPDGSAAVLFKVSVRQARGSDVRPRLSPECETITQPSSEADARSIRTRWTIDCGEQGLIDRTITIDGLERARIDTLVRLVLSDGRLVSSILRASEPSLVIPERQTRSSVLTGYVGLGFEHILSGLDHLAFVLGLLLLVPGTRQLIQTVTAFTVGHSATLTLAVIGFTNVSPPLVELLIAASVLYLACEIGRPAGSGSPLKRRPWLVALAFGLLHGMGFAGALAEVGLPQGEIPLALFSFNVGIELGQLVFVFAVLALSAVVTRLPLPHPPWAKRIPAYGIGSLAAFWCFERAASLF